VKLAAAGLLVAALWLACSDPVEKAKQLVDDAEAALADRRPAEAIAALERAREIAPEHLPAHVMLGRAYAASGDLEKAVERYAFVAERSPDYPFVWQQWGVHLAELGRDEQAVAVLEQAAKLDDEVSATVRYWWGTSLHRLGRLAEAAVQYRAALAAAPDHARAHNNLGVLLSTSPDTFDDGIAELERALQLQPDEPSFQYNLGATYLRVDRWQEARDLIERAVKATDPKHPDYANRVRDLERARAALASRDRAG
jgi:tetratricopeptide (TPR) repeat protein